MSFTFRSVEDKYLFDSRRDAFFCLHTDTKEELINILNERYPGWAYIGRIIEEEKPAWYKDFPCPHLIFDWRPAYGKIMCRECGIELIGKIPKSQNP